MMLPMENGKMDQGTQLALLFMLNHLYFLISSSLPEAVHNNVKNNKLIQGIFLQYTHHNDTLTSSRFPS